MSFAPAVDVRESRWRDVRIAAVARGASIGGDILAATALLLALQGRGAGGVAIAAVLIAASAPLVLLAPLSGRLVDRVDSRLLLTTVGVAQAACCVAMAYAQSTPVLITLVAVVAAGASITQPTFAALVADMVRRDDLPRAMATMQTATSIGLLIGPPAAGLLTGEYGLRAPLLLDAVTFLGISLAGLLIATRRRGSTGTAEVGAPAGPPAPVWSLRRDPLLMPTMVMIGLVIAVISTVSVVDVFFVRETLHASTTMYGVVGATWTGAMVIGSWLVARRRADDSGYAVLMSGSLALTCAVVGVAGLVPDVWWLMALFVIGGAANGAENSISAVLVSRRAPAPVRGRAFGYLAATAHAANIGGFAAGGILVGRFAPATILVASGVLGLAVVAACMQPMLRAARRERVRVAAVGPCSPAAATMD
ncbi:MAG TPA: MFS transporter [Planosporangium sp.]|jgi:MFS family permease|nr:MFS transporter [Planosporangium sp.]